MLILFAGIAQLARASPFQGEGCGFESHCLLNVTVTPHRGKHPAVTPDGQCELLRGKEKTKWGISSAG